MKPKTLPLFALLVASLTHPLAAAAYTWDGGGGTGAWTTAANWLSDPTPIFDNTAALTFTGATQTSTFIGNNTTVQSITFNSGANSFSLSTRAGIGSTQAGRSLTFSAASGNSTITVDATVTSNQSINGGNVTGSGTGGSIVLSSSLDVVQNSDKYQTGTDINGNPTYFYPKLTLGQNSNGISGSDTSISGAGAINKSGVGILVLAGANTFTGGVNISNGRVELQNNTAAGTNSITLANTGAELEIGAGLTVSNALIVSNTGNAKTLRHLDDSTPGDPIYSGQITINETANGNFKIQIGANDHMSISGKITGTGGAGIQKVGAGTLTLTNTANDYTGLTTLTTGILNFATNTLSSGNISMNDGTLQWATGNTQDVSSRIVMNAGKTAYFDTNGNPVTFNNAVGSSSSSAFTKLGSGTLTLTKANTYTGLTTVSAGHLLVTDTGSLATHNSLTLASAATTEIQTTGQSLNAVTNDNTATNALHFSAASGTTTITTLTGTGYTRFASHASITNGVSSGTVSTGGNLTANVSGGTVNVAGTLTGQISNGTITAQTLSSSTVSGGTLNLQGASHSITTLNGGAINLANNAQLSVSNGNSSGAISGTNATLNKISSGSLTLSGNNTYSGGTFVSAGTLHASSNANLGTGAVTVNGGELNLTGNVTKTVSMSSGKISGSSPGITVNISGASAITGTLGTVNTGTDPSRAINTTGNVSINQLSGQASFSGGAVTITGTHNPGNSPGTQSFANGLAYANTSTVILEIAADGSAADSIDVTGGLTIGTGVQVLVNLYGTANYSTTFWDSNHTFNLLTTDTASGAFQSIDFTGLGTSPANGSWSVVQNAGDITATWTAVPELSTSSLSAFALLTLCFYRRRTRKA